MPVQIACTLTMDGGEVLEVTADQRDMATAEQVMGRKGLSTTGNPVTFARCLGWAAARRTGHTTDSWDSFDPLLVDATTTDPEPVDPTRPGMSDG